MRSVSLNRVFYTHTPTIAEHKASKDQDQKIRREKEVNVSQWTGMAQPSYLGFGQRLPGTNEYMYRALFIVKS